jgi:hypothetical protein
MQHIIAIVLCKFWYNIGAGRFRHILRILQVSPHVITGWLQVWKNIFGVNNLNRNDINTAVTASLHRLSEDEFTAAIDHLTPRWEMSVDSKGDYID